MEESQCPLKTRLKWRAPKASGVGTIIADKHAKGHIQKLRLEVGGITYDIDV